VPLPVGINPELLDTPFTDFGGEYRPKPVPPKPNRFVANVNATFMQQVFDISKRKWIPNIHHHGQPNDLGASLKISKWRRFCHEEKLENLTKRLNLFSSDSAVPSDATSTPLGKRG